MTKNGLSSILLAAVIAATPIASSATLVLMSSHGAVAGEAKAERGKAEKSDESRGKSKGHDKDKAKGKAKGHDKDKGKGRDKGKGKGHDKDKGASNAKGQSKDDNAKNGNAFGRSKQDERSVRRAHRDGRDDRGRRSAQSSASGKRSLSPSWSKRTPPAPPARMIPLPASTFSRSDLAPETSPRPQTRSS